MFNTNFAGIKRFVNHGFNAVKSGYTKIPALIGNAISASKQFGNFANQAKDRLGKIKEAYDSTKVYTQPSSETNGAVQRAFGMVSNGLASASNINTRVGGTLAGIQPLF
jgi:hypothetical protein